MFAMSYLNLQMFWPRYVHYYVDTDELLKVDTELEKETTL